MNNQFDVKKIPKFFYLLIGTILALVLFIILVATPLIQDGPSMQAAHTKHLQTVRDYENALKLQASIEDEIEKNKKEYEKQKKELFVDLDTSSREIEQYCRNKDIDLNSYNLSKPQTDPQNRVSTGGYPVKTVEISLSYTDTYEKTLNLLKYFETGSNGCYYVKSCSLLEEGEGKKDKFNTSVAMTLYYYDLTDDSLQSANTEEATEPATEG